MVVSARVQGLIDDVNALKVMDLVALKDALQHLWGVSASPLVAVAVPTETSLVPDPVEEQTAFDVVVTAHGAAKLQVIKTVRELTSLDLKTAKDVIDNVEARPFTLKAAVAREEADALAEKLRVVGASVEVR